MKDLICGCFGRVPVTLPQPATLNSSEALTKGLQSQEQGLTLDSASVEFQALSDLRARLAFINSQQWLAKLNESAVLIADTCDAGLTGLLGLTASGGQASLVVLATGGAAAANLGIGEILPWDPHLTGKSPNPAEPMPTGALTAQASGLALCYTGASHSAVSLPPWEPPPCWKTVTSNLRPMATGEEADDGTKGTSMPQLQKRDINFMRRCLLHSSGSMTTTAALGTVAASDLPPLGSEPWARVLGALQRALPASGPARWHVVLLPLSLQDRQVGALLLALPVDTSGGRGGDGVGAIVNLHDINGGRNENRNQQVSALPSPSMTGAGGVLRRGLLRHGTLLAALGQCVTECCLAPVMPAIGQVCTSCALLNSCTTLQELSTCLTTTLTTTLTSELHVELMIRLALLPSKDAPQGLLFEDATRMRGATSTGCTATAPTGANAHAASPLSRSAAVSFLAVHRASGQQQQPASPRGMIRGPMASGPAGYSARTCGSVSIPASWGSGIGGGTLSSRVPLLQAEAARSTMESGGPVNSDDVLCAVPLNHGSVSVGQAATTMPGWSSSNSMKWSIPGAMGCGTTSAGASRRVISTPQSSSSRGQVRASPMSMTSTLAAALLSGAAAAAAKDVASSNDTGAGRISNNYAKLPYVDTGGGSTATAAAGAPYTVRLIGSVIPNVHLYLQDMEQPTADVFTVLRRHGANPVSASLVAIAAWSPARSSGGMGAGAHRGSSTDPAIEAKLSPRQQLADSIFSNAGIEGGAVGGGTTSVASCTASTQLGPSDGSLASNANISPPAFVMYLTSAMPLPPQLLGAVRDRAMALLEILLPAAARALSSAVQDEWSFVCTHVAGGGLATVPNATSAVGEMPRSCSLVAADRATGSGLTGAAPSQGEAAHFVSGGRTQTGAASSVLGPSRTGPTSATAAAAAGGTGSQTMPSGIAALDTSQPLLSSRSAHGMLSSSPAARVTGGGRTLAAISPVRTCDGDSPGAGDSMLHLLPSSPAKSVITRAATREDVSSSSARRAYAPPSTAALKMPASGRGNQRLSAPVTSGLLGSPAHPRSQLESCNPLETFASSSGLLALEEDDGPGEGSAGGESGGDGTGGGANTLLLNTLLSYGADTAKTARQAQLDIMVSTYHNVLSKARHEAGALGGLHADDDVRNLRLIKTIGMGGCSVVLLARLHSMPVAVKVILPPADDNEEEEKEKTGASGQGGQLGTRGGKVSREHEQEDDEADVVLLPPSGSLQSSRFEGAGATKPAAAFPALEMVSRVRDSAVARQVQMRLLMRGARELAVMTSISHPNIVQVYSYCTRVVVQETASGLPKLEVLEEETVGEDPICTALIMEYCDMGSLADAIDSGAFARATRYAAAALHGLGISRAAPPTSVGQTDRKALGGFVAITGGSGFRSGSIVRAAPTVSMEAAAMAGTPSMRAIYLTLLEVALALRHLHSLSLVHSDVKPANVLLRSSATDPRGFTAKLTDFGFVNLIEQRQSDCGLLMEASTLNSSRSGDRAGRQSIKFAEPVGTVTHMAPELFIQGYPVDSSIDIYAFGILMWELSTGRAPYPEYAEKQFLEVPFKVVKEGLRPRFPSDTPLHYKLLAQECWTAQPVRRPTAASLVSRLQRLLDLSCGFNTDRKQNDVRVSAGGGGGVI
ncbi:hypothetical protein VaNZ11_001181 [Volvox africanus]|uniref:Protein kinase domain-containing protein n=1 Tax=Volvox africanus TaxID=51714 RepID=A0ABQ5RPE7_9CHLO|nr:hypothetical protein VaNZ11_001181 [Volvox africanus]